MEDWTQTENRDDISELEDDRTFELIGDLKEFILSTRPLESLIADMKSWLKVDEQRIKTKANPLIRTTADIQVDRDKSDGSGKLDELEATKRDCLLEDPLLLSITDQLQSVNPSQIWESGPQRTTSNQLKGIIEDFFGEPWIWWPLSPRFGEMPVGKTRLHWICGCGRERFAVVPKEFATQAVQSAIGKTHSPSEVTIPLSTHTGSQRINPENNDSMSRAHFPTQFKSQDPSTSQVTYDTQDHPCTQRPKDLHIFFIVASGPKIGDRHRLAQLKVGAKTSTDDFFKWLQEQYFKLRGSFRSFLSIRVYSHCDFYMFHKWDVNMYGPAEQNSFPDSNSPYYYLPRPMWPIPPITEDQFYHRFYSCYKPRAFHRPFHKCRKRCSDRTTLDRLPLRQYSFQVEDDKEEHFWGMYAVTRISFARVMVYSVVCFAPAIFPAMVFFFLWLFSWGHEGDLQNLRKCTGVNNNAAG
ncbi:hypothetical protein QBC37DRAFT_297685 [Rhypophila decipiens]|uniref:Uncharacterized protein n=1 Tax=Rhypophila decipiens TaxID=261697 RepID=A0AAN6XYB9_9PEZI|nr:hypothetical protein QBC37DRAFT_297685 [Rhypophila decipiens]